MTSIKLRRVKNKRLFALYIIISLLIGLLYIPETVRLIQLNIPSIIIDIPFYPLPIYIDLTLLSKVLLIVGVFLYISGLIFLRSDILIFSTFITHILFTTTFLDRATSIFGMGVYPITIQMLILTILYLLSHNFLIKSRFAKGKINIIGYNVTYEIINFLLNIAGPLLLTFFFLVLNKNLILALIEFIKLIPEPLDNIIYIYLFNPYSQLFTTIIVLGGIIWIMKSLVEPIILYLRLGREAAMQQVLHEYNNFKGLVERKYLKVKVGMLPPHPSMAVIYMIIIAIISTFITLIFIMVGVNKITSFINQYIAFIIDNFGSLSYSQVKNAPKTWMDSVIGPFIENIAIKFRIYMIWILRILKFLFWWVWA